MDDRKLRLIASAERLCRLGADLETARARLALLAERGDALDSAEMEEAYQAFCRIEREWSVQERAHQILRDEILQN